MERKNETMTVQGYSGKKKKAIKQEQSFSDSNNPKHYGMPITACTFWKMLDNFRQTDTSQRPEFQDLWWVEFSKASIFRILAQENCEYVRFYFAIPDLQTNKASLLLQGIGSDGNTIKAKILKEVAVEMSDPNYDPDNSQAEDTLLENISELAPATEEKGNGGKGAPFLGEKNVQSIGDFLQWLKDNNKSFLNMDLATFAKYFLDYADKQSSIK